jgi:hypothetical protein
MAHLLSSGLRKAPFNGLLCRLAGLVEIGASEEVRGAVIGVEAATTTTGWLWRSPGNGWHEKVRS